MWMIILVASAHGVDLAPLTDRVAEFRYATQGECLVSAANRADALRSANAHGRYMCMYHGEPDREMRNAPKFSF